MTITETPKIKIERIDNSGLRKGSGGQIPIFISPTANETPAEGIKGYSKFEECNKLVTAGGIGTATSNILLPILKDFFEENIPNKSEDDIMSVPMIYVKDLGTSSPTAAGPWINAIKEVKTKRNIQVEAYVFKKEENVTASNIVSIMTSVAEAIDKDVIKGNPRLAYFTVLDFNDTEIQTLTNASGIQNSAVTIVIAILTYIATMQPETLAAYLPAGHEGFSALIIIIAAAIVNQYSEEKRVERAEELAIMKSATDLGTPLDGGIVLNDEYIPNDSNNNVSDDGC